MKIDDRYRHMFFIASFVFVLFQSGSLNNEGILYTSIEALGIVNVVAFVAFAFVFLTSKGIYRKDSESLLNVAFWISIFSFCAAFLVPGQVFVTMSHYLLHTLFNIGFFFMLLFPVFFLVSVGIILHRYNGTRLSYVFVAAALLLLLVLYYPNIVFKKTLISDEMFIAYEDTGIFLHGGNPYATSFGNLLYSNVSLRNSTQQVLDSWTLTSSNQVMGFLNYPALFLLSSLPFYFLSMHGIGSYLTLGLGMQQAVSLFILVLAFALSLDSKQTNKPVFSIMVFTAAIIVFEVSGLMPLMLALLILAYVKLESRYSWIILGLCASLQELLWLPVLFLILYSFNNEGIKKGLYKTFGAAFVFLLVNSYFIAINPHAFFGQIFNPLNSLIFPNTSAGIGYLFTLRYGTLSGTGHLVFELAVAFLSIAFLYINQKKLVGIFSMLPFAFLQHAIAVYYALFVVLTAAIVLARKDGHEGGHGIIGGALRGSKPVFYFMLALPLLAGIAIVYASHLAYVKNFSMSITNATLQNGTAANTIVYTALLHYHNLSNNTAYVVLLGADTDVYYYGFGNHTIIEGPVDCTGKDYTCYINRNRIVLNPYGQTYRLVLHVNSSRNGPIYRAGIIVYNGEYLYLSNGTDLSPS